MSPGVKQNRLARGLESPKAPNSASFSNTSTTYFPVRRQSKSSVRNSSKRRRSVSSPANSSLHRDSVWRNMEEDGFEYNPLGRSDNGTRPSLNRTDSLKMNVDHDGDNDVKNSQLDLKEEDEDELQKLKEVGQLASVFLEVRKGIMDEFNIDASHNEKLELEREHNKHLHHKKISKSTLNRAEKVKLMFNLYYLALFQAQKVTNPQYEGVDGVFNPLQIIRNRKLRKKYHQYPQVSIKTLPLASTAFSTTKTPLLWELDVSELTYDSSWRAQHWHELINPDGELWFPEERKDKRHHHRLHFRNSMHDFHKNDNGMTRYDKLFDNAKDDDFLNRYANNEESNEMNNNSNTDMENVVFQSSRSSSKSDLLEASPRGDRRKRDILINKMRSKSPFKKSLSHTEDGGRLETMTSTDSSSSRKLENTVIDVDDEVQTPQSFKILNDIEIEPINPTVRVTAETPVSSRFSEPEERNTSNIYLEPSPRFVLDDDDHEYEQNKIINGHIDTLRFLNTMVSFYNHDFEYKKVEYKNLTNFANLDNHIYDLQQNFTSLKNVSLPKYEEILKGKSEELRDIQNELLNDYSTRIDKMLTSTDRTIGEVNTTLSLEIRKLKERFEKVNSFKNKRSQCDELLNFAYWALENLVVIILWFIWIVFSILRVIKFSFLLVIGLLNWIIS